MATELPRRFNLLPELLTLVLGWVLVRSCLEDSKPTLAAGLVEVPIPAKRLIGGTTPLSPGQWVTLKAFAPEDAAFRPQCYPRIEIRELSRQDEAPAVRRPSRVANAAQPGGCR